MPHARQRVVFGTDRQVQRSGAAAGQERRRQIGEVLLHGESGVGEGTGHPGARSLLLPSDFGMGVQIVGQRQDAVGRAVARRPDGVFEGDGHRSPGTP